MATIGTLGKTVFAASRKQVRTFNDLVWKGSARYATHDRHLKTPMKEFLGPGDESMSFTILLSRYLGVNPFTEINRLNRYRRRGKVLSLVLGKRRYGTYRWVITNTTINLEKYAPNGSLLHAKVTVEIQAYAKR